MNNKLYRVSVSDLVVTAESEKEAINRFREWVKNLEISVFNVKETRISDIIKKI